MNEESFERYVYFENHKKVLAQSIDNFLIRQSFVDMTLVCSGGKKIKVHRTVLAACSPFFEDILLDIDDQSHPVLVFNDISEDLMVCIVEFMYKGKTDISRAFVEAFLNIAKKLKIRGLENQYMNLMEDFSQCPTSATRDMSGLHRKQKPSAKEISTGNSKSEPNSHPPEKLPLTIKTGTAVKVINPFALKRIQRDSDSTSTEDDLCVPGPSKPNSTKEPVSSETGNVPEDDDSDIEFIEDNLNPSVVVINESQSLNSVTWCPKEQANNKRPIISTKATSDVEYNSDDSEIQSTHKKKKKSADDTKSDSDESTKNADAKEKNSLNHHHSDSSESPELITPVDMKDLPRAIIDTVKEEIPSNFSETEYLQKPFQGLGRYCVICKVFKKNIGLHVKRLHSVPIRKQAHSCKTCSKIFYMKYTLQIHKCLS